MSDSENDDNDYNIPYQRCAALLAKTNRFTKNIYAALADLCISFEVFAILLGTFQLTDSESYMQLTKQSCLYTYVCEHQMFDILIYLIETNCMQQHSKFLIGDLQTEVSSSVVVSSMFSICAQKENLEMMKYIHTNLKPPKHSHAYRCLFADYKQAITPKMLEIYKWLKCQEYTMHKQVMIENATSMNLKLYKFQIEQCKCDLTPVNILIFIKANRKDCLDYCFEYLTQHPELLRNCNHTEHISNMCDLYLVIMEKQREGMNEYKLNLLFFYMHQWTMLWVKVDSYKGSLILHNLFDKMVTRKPECILYWQYNCFRDFMIEAFDYLLSFADLWSNYKIQDKIQEIRETKLFIHECLRDCLHDSVIKFVLDAYL